MATSINDLSSSTDVSAGLYPADITATTNGSTVNLSDADGPCFAIQFVGEADGDGTLSGFIEESADGTNWSAISGAMFAEVTASNSVQVIRFDRSLKFVRWVGTLAGSSPEFVVAVLIGEMKKTF